MSKTERIGNNEAADDVFFEHTLINEFAEVRLRLIRVGNALALELHAPGSGATAVFDAFDLETMSSVSRDQLSGLIQDSYDRKAAGVSRAGGS